MGFGKKRKLPPSVKKRRAAQQRAIQERARVSAAKKPGLDYTQLFTLEETKEYEDDREHRDSNVN